MRAWKIVGCGALVIAAVGEMWAAFADAAPKPPAHAPPRTHPDGSVDKSPVAHAPSHARSDGGVEKSQPPPQPTVTTVYPAVGSPGTKDAPAYVELFGSHFQLDPHHMRVFFGPGGVSRECARVNVLSDSLLRCYLPDKVVSGEAEHFVVVSKSDGGTVSSEVSSGTYTQLPGPKVLRMARSDNDASVDLQVHISGLNFGGGDIVPTVTFSDTDAGDPYFCDLVEVLSPEELICSIPRSVYDSFDHPLHFTVLRPSP